jgi:hypothetical protein
VLCEDLLILPPNNVSAAPDQQTWTAHPIILIS